METELGDYIFNYYSKFCNDKERKAMDHHFGQVKIMDRYPDDAPKQIHEAKKRFFTDDPEALELIKDGYPNFIMKTAERIYRDHKSELKLNLCPKCNKIALTPQAKQCRFCVHDRH
jgi:phage-related protein